MLDQQMGLRWVKYHGALVVFTVIRDLSFSALAQSNAQRNSC